MPKRRMPIPRWARCRRARCSANSPPVILSTPFHERRPKAQSQARRRLLDYLPNVAASAMRLDVQRILQRSSTPFRLPGRKAASRRSASLSDVLDRLELSRRRCIRTCKEQGCGEYREDMPRFHPSSPRFVPNRSSCTRKGSLPRRFDARARAYLRKALPIHEVAFPVHVQLASSDSQFQRGVERQPSDFRLPIDREQHRCEHDAQNGKAKQASKKTPPTPFPEGNENAAAAVSRIRRRTGMGAGRLARIEPVGDQDSRTLIGATAVSRHRPPRHRQRLEGGSEGRPLVTCGRDSRDGCRAGQQ